MNCEHVCSSDCRREGCECECGPSHQEGTFKTIETLVEEKAEVMGGLSGHQREVYRKMLEQGDKENHGDYVYGQDEGEINKGNVREY